MARKLAYSRSIIGYTNRFIRIFITKFSFLVLLIAFGVVFILQKNENKIYEASRGAVIDVVAPIISKLGSGFNYIFGLKELVRDIANVYKENQKLKIQLDKMINEVQLFENVISENRELKKLLHYVEAGYEHRLAARIYISSASPFSKSIIISVGADDGAYKGQVIINDKGIVGRVIEVNRKTSRILLITDPNSRISVISEKTRERGIVIGNTSNYLDLKYVRDSAALEEGEVILSSGDGELVPYGIAVGVVKKEGNNKYTVKPFVNIDEIEYVSVIDSSE